MRSWARSSTSRWPSTWPATGSKPARAWRRPAAGGSSGSRSAPVGARSSTTSCGRRSSNGSVARNGPCCTGPRPWPSNVTRRRARSRSPTTSTPPGSCSGRCPTRCPPPNRPAGSMPSTWLRPTTGWRSPPRPTAESSAGWPKGWATCSPSRAATRRPPRGCAPPSPWSTTTRSEPHWRASGATSLSSAAIPARPGKPSKAGCGCSGAGCRRAGSGSGWRRPRKRWSRPCTAWRRACSWPGGTGKGPVTSSWPSASTAGWHTSTGSISGRRPVPGPT